MKNHVQNVTFLTASAPATEHQVKIVPASKPGGEPQITPAVEQSNRADVQEWDESEINPASAVAEIEEDNIPVPVMLKPLPADQGHNAVETVPPRRRTPTIRRTGSRRDG